MGREGGRKGRDGQREEGVRDGGRKRSSDGMGMDTWTRGAR